MSSLGICVFLQEAFKKPEFQQNYDFMRLGYAPPLLHLSRHLGGCKILAVDNMEPLRSVEVGALLKL